MRTTITSSSNDKIKYVRSLYQKSIRYKEHRFVIEGVRLLQEALGAGTLPALVLYVAAFAERAENRGVMERLRELHIPGAQVSPQVFSTVTDTVTPQGILAVVPFPELESPEAPTLALIIDQVRIPGNLGTLLRSAEAAGVDLVLLTKGSIDVYAPKVVRGGMGVHFRLPIDTEMAWDDVGERIDGCQVYVADANAARPYYGVDWRQRSALIVGSEAHGPSPEAYAHMTEAIQIPMSGQTESLNVGVAGSVILFEAARQRQLAVRSSPLARD